MADNQTTAAEPTNGRVTRVQGSVIDVEFPVGHLPDIYNALKVTIVNTGAKEEGEAKETEITLEVEQHLGDSTVRCVALKPTDGLVRGASVSDTGAPISVPVGDVTKGHVFDVSGNILNKKPDETITVSERWPIHRNPPAFDQLESKTQMFETGIKVIDLLSNLSDDRALAVFERNGVVQIGKLTVGEANIKDRSDNLYDSTGIWQYGHSFQDCSAPATISVISCVIAP